LPDRNWDPRSRINDDSPLTEVQSKELCNLSLLQLSSQQLHDHLRVPAADRSVYSVLEVTNVVGVVTSAYFLHRHLLHPPVLGQQLTQSGVQATMVPLCTVCFASIEKEQRRHQRPVAMEEAKPPEFSIAAGYDYGAPWWLDLPPLSLAEQKLIALNL